MTEFLDDAAEAAVRSLSSYPVSEADAEQARAVILCQSIQLRAITGAYDALLASAMTRKPRISTMPDSEPTAASEACRCGPVTTRLAVPISADIRSYIRS